uniref:Uncharacterized protein n=1 Tax=Arundo donax TaxID=35708 RepID=A0A0A9EBV9_ARUDO
MQKLASNNPFHGKFHHCLLGDMETRK